MNRVYYFSGTGNCLAAAKAIAGKLNGIVLPINAALVKTGALISCDVCVLVFPSYGYGMPKMLHSFLKNCKIRARYVAAVVTYGSQQGGALMQAKRLIERGGGVLSYAGGIKSVENYLPFFGFLGEKKFKAAIERHREQESRVADEIAGGVVRPRLFGFRLFSYFVSALFRLAIPLLAGACKVNEDCNGCGLCKKVCPAEAVRVEAGQKMRIDGKKCEHCQACLNICPKNAISLMRFKAKSKRYRHPDVGIDELMNNSESKSCD